MEFATKLAEDSKTSTPSAPAVVLTLKAGGGHALPLLRRRGGDSKEFPSNDKGLFSKCAVISELRRYTNEPYTVHLQAATDMVRARDGSPEMIAAAWLHDTVEDTGATIEGLRREFGDTVADLVADLTDISRREDGNRAARKALDRAHTAKASPEAKTIKLADLIDNTRSIVEHDTKFAKVYLAEKAALLEVLKESDQSLWIMAKELLEESQGAL